MHKLPRLWISLWALGTLVIILSNYSGPFKYIGLSRMHVFNSYSLDLAEWIYVFKRDGATLPFMNEDGRRLSWFLDENIKYRGFFRMNSRKMMLLDFCREKLESATYELHTVNASKKIDSKEEFKLERKALSESEGQACEKLAQLNSLVVF